MPAWPPFERLRDTNPNPDPKRHGGARFWAPCAARCRLLRAVAWDPREPQSRALLYGGYSLDAGMLSDLWSVDTTTWAWRREAQLDESCDRGDAGGYFVPLGNLLVMASPREGALAFPDYAPRIVALGEGGGPHLTRGGGMVEVLLETAVPTTADAISLALTFEAPFERFVVEAEAEATDRGCHARLGQRQRLWARGAGSGLGAPRRPHLRRRASSATRS